MSPSVKPFNELKYKALIDGLECSEIMFSKINFGDRFDSDYFTKKYLYISNILGKLPTKKLGDLAIIVTSAFYPAATQLYSIGDTAFARCIDCINYPIITKEQNNNFEKIPYKFALETRGISILKAGDIIITKVGTPCYASIITEYPEIALSRTVLGLTKIHDIDPYYLMIFLRCKYGFEQLFRERELTIQYQLTLNRIKRIDIFNASNNFQSVIQYICLIYSKNFKQSKFLYDEAEQMVNNFINLNELNKIPITNKLLSNSFYKTGRLDAEYYQPKYDILFNILKKFPCENLGGKNGLVLIKKSIEPGTDLYQDNGIPFVRVGDVTKFEITPPEIHLSLNLLKDATKLYPKKNTILFSKDGSIGIAYKMEKDEEIITSGALLHLIIKDQTKILPEYLTLILNSPIVQLQAERDSNGAIIQHWKPSDIEKVVIPILNMKIQKILSEKVKEAFTLRRESQQLLEYLKQAVEIAIEQNEKIALDWLKKKGVYNNVKL